MNDSVSKEGTRYDAEIERISRGHHVKDVDTALITFVWTKPGVQSAFMIPTELLDANSIQVGDLVSFDWATPHDHFTIIKIRDSSRGEPLRSVDSDPGLWTRVVRALGYNSEGVKQP